MVLGQAGFIVCCGGDYGFSQRRLRFFETFLFILPIKRVKYVKLLIYCVILYDK